MQQKFMDFPKKASIYAFFRKLMHMKIKQNNKKNSHRRGKIAVAQMVIKY